MLEPPPEGVQDTSAAALAAAQAWAREQGLALVTKSTAKGGRYISSHLKRKNSTAHRRSARSAYEDTS
ncbi:hypothetical protein V8E36_006344 [Tilletia maclaganii]